MPTPRLSTATLPPAYQDVLYEARVTTNTPAMVRFEITAGALPEGLTLNPDTGGIIGTPVRSQKARFTITARNAAGLPDAHTEYEITVRDRLLDPIPHLGLTAPDQSTALGVATTAVSTFINGEQRPVHDVRLTLTAPAGWQVQAASPTVFDEVDVGESVTTSWKVTPADAAEGDYTLAAKANYRGAGGPGAVEATAQVTIKLPNLSLGKPASQSSVAYDGLPSYGRWSGTAVGTGATVR